MKNWLIMVMIAIGIMMAACSDNELNEHSNRWESNEPLMLTASINEAVVTKAEGNFTAGGYYFSYVNNTQTSEKYTDTQTEFDEYGTGISNLTWDKINISTNIKNELFILDNVPYKIVKDNVTYFNKSTNSSKINLSKIKENNSGKYSAAQAPETPGTGNDLLWATVNADDMIPLSPVHFELEHRMSMLTFELYSSVDKIKEMLKGDVQVKLENVITEPTNFNRVTGVIDVDYTKYIKNIDNMELEEPIDEDNGVIRSTKSWIFPPQQFHTIGRPVLEVTLKDGTDTKKFRGRLPESMIYNNKSELLEFISGCHLIIVVELGNWDDMEIRFRPVLVKKWKSKTDVDINVDQVGIRSADELLSLVSIYNSNPKDPKLWKYGVLKNDKWYFDLWSNINIDTIKNDLGFEKNNPSFIIRSNGHTVNGKKVNEDGTLTDTTNQ